MARGSLLDDSGFDSIGAKKNAKGAKASGGGGSSPQTVKIAVASVLLLLAAGVLAWNFGLLGGAAEPQTQREAAKPPQVSPEEQKQLEQQRIKFEEAEKTGGTGGA